MNFLNCTPKVRLSEYHQIYPKLYSHIPEAPRNAGITIQTLNLNSNIFSNVLLLSSRVIAIKMNNGKEK